MKILVTSPAFNQPGMMKIREFLNGVIDNNSDEVIYNPYGRTLTKEELLELWQGVDGIIAGIESYTEDVFKLAPKSLKIISRFGTGYESIEVSAAGEQGIAIANTPGVNATAVADLTLGLMISLARRIPLLDKKSREGQWIRTIGVGLAEKKLGIIGFGAIGKEVAIRAKGFSMDVLAYDPFFDKDFAHENNIKESSVEQILKEADFITLHVPVTKETEKMINKENLNKMKSNAFIINAARGQLVDEEALYEALKNGRIAGAGLDVFQQEPPGKTPLFELDNVVVTPHIGGHTQEASELMGKTAIENVISFLKNGNCPFIVNKKYLK